MVSYNDCHCHHLCRVSEDEDGDSANGESVYRIKYERAARELEFTKRRLQTQHEHDLEQLVGLKKQLEKKVRVMCTYGDTQLRGLTRVFLVRLP